MQSQLAKYEGQWCTCTQLCNLSAQTHWPNARDIEAIYTLDRHQDSSGTRCLHLLHFYPDLQVAMFSKTLVPTTRLQSVTSKETVTIIPFEATTWNVCREEKPTRCHSMLYCTYDMLNMFRALLCPSSGALDYMCVIAAYGVQCLAAGCRGQVQGSRMCVQEEGCCTTQSCSIHLPGRTPCCSAPDPRQPITKHCTP